MTIVIGSWGWPLLATVVLVVAYVWWDNSNDKEGHPAAGVLGCIGLLVTLICILASWLVWALVA